MIYIYLKSMKETIATLLANNVIKISFGTGIVFMGIFWRQYALFSVVMWLFLTSIDMIIGRIKTKYITKTFNSHVFWRWLIKRWVVLITGLVIMIMWWTVAGLLCSFWDIDFETYKFVFSILWIGYFHLFSLQEISSIIEHSKQIDPNNSLFAFLWAITWLINKSVKEKVMDKITKAVEVYEELSPTWEKKDR